MTAILIFAAFFTPIDLNPAEPHPETVLESIYGAGSFYRVSDDADLIIPGDSIESVVPLASFAASTNVFFSVPTPGGFIGCIQTSLFYTADHCTDPALNGGVDYVATWRLFADPDVFLLGFEDWPFDSPMPGTDYNFNDLIVEVRVGHSDIPQVPEPGAVTLLGLGLLGLAARRRR